MLNKSYYTQDEIKDIADRELEIVQNLHKFKFMKIEEIGTKSMIFDIVDMIEEWKEDGYKSVVYIKSEHLQSFLLINTFSRDGLFKRITFPAFDNVGFIGNIENTKVFSDAYLKSKVDKLPQFSCVLALPKD